MPASIYQSINLVVCLYQYGQPRDAKALILPTPETRPLKNH